MCQCSESSRWHPTGLSCYSEWQQLLSSAAARSIPLHILILPAHFALHRPPDNTSTQVHIHSVRLISTFSGSQRRRYPETVRLFSETEVRWTIANILSRFSRVTKHKIYQPDWAVAVATEHLLHCNKLPTGSRDSSVSIVRWLQNTCCTATNCPQLNSHTTDSNTATKGAGIAQYSEVATDRMMETSWLNAREVRGVGASRPAVGAHPALY